MPDIDSEDEDPDLSFVFEDCGVEYNIFKQISTHSCMFVFFHAHVLKCHLRKPNYFKAVMERVEAMMEKDKAEAECLTIGGQCFVKPFN